ncbi:MAG: ABC transporter ATP-binding protein [Aureliella sp.]
MQQAPQSIPGPSRFLPDVQAWLPEGLSTLSQFTYLLVATAAIVVITALLLLLLYRQTQVVAVKLETALVQRLRRHARSLATARTLSAQQLALTDCLDYHLPRARSVLARWWRAFPRHVVQAFCCLVFMLLVQPMLLVLTVVATCLVYLVFRFYDRVRRSALPVVRERAGHLRSEMIDECISGPLRSFSQPDGAVEQRFGEHLALYERDAVRSLTSSAWKTPAILVSSAVIVGVFLFLIAVQILSSDTSFTVPGAFVFTLCFIGAVVSVERLQRGIRDLKSVAPAADSLQHFLSLPVETYDSESLQKIDRISSGIELDHVTVQDSSGRKLLENVSAHLKPEQLIGVVATQPLEARALVELLMGFGRPVSGRLLFDGKPVTDLDPESIAGAAHWVAPTGAIATGTLRENIITKPDALERLDDIVRQAGLLETVQRLPDALNTLITPDDDRLRGDDGFRIGLARGAASGASVIVVDEPKRSYDADGEKTTLSSIRSLVNAQAITVVLPTRLLTLRSCDAVVMLSEHTVADVGTHSELLQRNEYYRHLNYLRFNPYQPVQ